MKTHQILGINFFGGTSREAVEAITHTGGLLVAPAAPSLINLCRDEDYRRALLGAALAIADSGFMVLLWKLFTGESVPRISGLEHVKRLLEHPSVREPGAVVWVVPTERSRAKLRGFLAMGQRTFQRFSVSDVSVSEVYVAPKYGRPEEVGRQKEEGRSWQNEGVPVEDEALLALVRRTRPRHVVIAVGGGIQDKLGQYLLAQLDDRPAVHCIGAALGFLTGDQVRIPDWADKFYVGWVFRSLAQPKVFVPRFWSARKLPWLIWKYRGEMPPLRGGR